MKIASLKMRPLEIAFKVAFKHTSADRKHTQSILVQAVTTDGDVGYGEGCPRGYVTGEDIDSCIQFFELHREEWLASIHSLAELEGWILEHALEIDLHPAAWCAVELSLIEIISKDLEQSVEKTLGFPELTGSFAYTAVLGDAEKSSFEAQVLRFAQVGFTDFKLKISGDVQVDSEKMNFVAKTIPGARMRIDANNIWNSFLDFNVYLNSIPISPFAIEEPLQAMDYAGMKTLVHESAIRIILDESFLNSKQFEYALQLNGQAIVNLRVSKMGGLMRSMAIAKRAQAEGMPLILGAHVGESTILTRAALVLAGAFRPNILAQEGAYGTHLLESDVVVNPIMFGKKGVLFGEQILSRERHGFGLDYLNNTGTFSP
jgi:L-Ala-D/L-Glu epimerase